MGPDGRTGPEFAIRCAVGLETFAGEGVAKANEGVVLRPASKKAITNTRQLAIHLLRMNIIFPFEPSSKRCSRLFIARPHSSASQARALASFARRESSHISINMAVGPTMKSA